MKPIGMPVSRLTADCIWNSFLNSGKRHIIITGGRGSGKTTLLSDLFDEKMPGLTSWAEPEKAVYLKENLCGNEVEIGEFDSSLSGFENKMVLKKEGFLSVGIPALMKYAESDSRWITVDEIGYLETQCSEYLEALLKLFDNKHVVAVVRKQNLPFLQMLCNRDDAFVVDLDDPFGNIGCVIMASGLGKRFGGNKLMADFKGEPLICHILDATEDIFSQRVVVTRHKDIENLCKERGIDTVFHNLPFQSDTVKLGLNALSDVDRCMFTVSDQPFISRETVVSLAVASKNNADAIFRPVYNGVAGSPVVFPKWAFGELLILEGENGGGAVIKKHPEHLRMINVRNENELKDIDSKEDLLNLQMK